MDNSVTMNMLQNQQRNPYSVYFFPRSADQYCQLSEIKYKPEFLEKYQLNKINICNIHIPNQKQIVHLKPIDYEVRIDFELIDKIEPNHDLTSIPLSISILDFSGNINTYNRDVSLINQENYFPFIQQLIQNFIDRCLNAIGFEKVEKVTQMIILNKLPMKNIDINAFLVEFESTEFFVQHAQLQFVPILYGLSFYVYNWFYVFFLFFQVGFSFFFLGILYFIGLYHKVLQIIYSFLLDMLGFIIVQQVVSGIPLSKFIPYKFKSESLSEIQFQANQSGKSSVIQADDQEEEEEEEDEEEKKEKIGKENNKDITLDANEGTIKSQNTTEGRINNQQKDSDIRNLKLLNDEDSQPSQTITNKKQKVD